ncbi:MAG: glutamine amidotransferase class-I [Parcubacteria group bacterium]|nr:glutamine amidotransferase class-I [Parcubacteria group bacterium]
MNILLIDNGTTLLEKLRALIPGDEIVHTWRDFSPEDVARADLIVLSGGSRMQLAGNEHEFVQEVEMILSIQKPLIGICFGTELIAHAFGGTLRELAVNHKGIKEVRFILPRFSGGRESIRVFENHRWIIDEMPKGFEIIAESDDGPEMIGHLTLPIYGMQFHPENYVDEAEGNSVFLQLFSMLSPKS